MASELLAETGQFPPLMARKLGRGSNGLLIQVAVCLVMAVVFKLDAIASIGSAVALLIFTMITAAHPRARFHRHAGGHPSAERGPGLRIGVTVELAMLRRLLDTTS